MRTLRTDLAIERHETLADAPPEGISLQRERAFLAALERTGLEDLLERVRRFTFPETEALHELLDYRQLLYTEWGRFMRQQLRETEL